MDEVMVPSRSAKKRAAKEIEQMAGELADMPDAQVAQLPLSDALAQALAEVRQTWGHGSRKRQLKFFSGLLRREPEQCEELRAFLAGEHQQLLDQNRRTHHLEQLRERLCDVTQRADALTEVQELLPLVDMAELKKWLNSYRGPQDKRAYRQVFRLLRAAGDAEEDS
nr:ribosome biogenesis factor YjgA [uncultured Desulfuromonas sp.]